MKSLIFFAFILVGQTQAAQHSSQKPNLQGSAGKLYECSKNFRLQEVSYSQVQIQTDYCSDSIANLYNNGYTNKMIFQIISMGVRDANNEFERQGNQLSFYEAYEEAKRLNTLKIQQEQQQQIQQQQQADGYGVYQEIQTQQQ